MSLLWSFVLLSQKTQGSSLTIRLAEFISASVRGEGQEKARGEILKRVQDDVSIGSLLTTHYSLHTAHRSSLYTPLHRGRGEQALQRID